MPPTIIPVINTDEFGFSIHYQIDVSCEQIQLDPLLIYEARQCTVKGKRISSFQLERLSGQPCIKRGTLIRMFCLQSFNAVRKLLFAICTQYAAGMQKNLLYFTQLIVIKTPQAA